LLRRNYLELIIGAIARAFVLAPSSKLRGVTKAAALHVIVSDFNHKLRPQRLPGQIFARAPAALATRDAMLAFIVFGPFLPGMIRQRVLSITREKLDKVFAHLIRKACAHPDMLERTRVVIQPKQQRTDRGVFRVLMPSKASDYAITIALANHPWKEW